MTCASLAKQTFFVFHSKLSVSDWFLLQYFNASTSLIDSVQQVSLFRIVADLARIELRFESCFQHTGISQMFDCCERKRSHFRVLLSDAQFVFPPV